jgi:tetratricopeptide (TPR) repeat protein
MFMYVTKHFRTFLQVGLISICSYAVVSVGSSTPAYAAKAAETQQVSAKVGKPLKKARELMAEKKWKEALAQTKEAAAIPGKTPAEDAIVNEMLAYCMMNLKDYAGAAATYETMLASNQFKPEEVSKRVLNISQLYFSIKNYPKTLQYSERYLKDNPNDLEVMRQIAEVYYLQNNFARSEEATKALIKTAKQKNVAVKEDWLKLLLSAQYNQDKQKDIVTTLEALLTSYPSDQYWSNMFKYASDSTFSDRQIINYLRLLHARGLMGQSEYIEVSELALATTNPGDAKFFLEDGFAKGKLGVGATKDREVKLLNLAKKQAAEDVALLPSLEKEALAKPTGEALVKIGEAYLGHGQYQNAVNAFSKGLAKGGVKVQDDVNINLGIAYLGLKNKDEAVKAFKKVPASSKLALVSRLWAIHAASVK